MGIFLPWRTSIGNLTGKRKYWPITWWIYVSVITLFWFYTTFDSSWRGWGVISSVLRTDGTCRTHWLQKPYKNQRLRPFSNTLEALYLDTILISKGIVSSRETLSKIFYPKLMSKTLIQKFLFRSYELWTTLSTISLAHKYYSQLFVALVSLFVNNLYQKLLLKCFVDKFC